MPPSPRRTLLERPPLRKTEQPASLAAISFFFNVVSRLLRYDPTRLLDTKASCAISHLLGKQSVKPRWQRCGLHREKSLCERKGANLFKSSEEMRGQKNEPDLNKFHACFRSLKYRARSVNPPHAHGVQIPSMTSWTPLNWDTWDRFDRSTALKKREKI